MTSNSSLLLFTESQKQTLTAIADTFIATLSPEEEERLIKSDKNSTDNRDQLSLFSRTKGTDIGIIGRVEKKLVQILTPKQFMELFLMLNLLSYRSASFMLTGHWKSFKDLSRQERETVLLKWKRSSSDLLRRMYNLFMGLILLEGYMATDIPLFRGLLHHDVLGQTYFESQSDYEKVEHEKLNMLTEAQALGYSRFDAIVVGSGAGGSVVAAELARSGMSVLVIEKGKYFDQDSIIPNDDQFAFNNMYENCGIAPSTEGTVNVLAGATFGGGTFVNYSASIEPPAYVKEEWSKLGLSYFTSQQFEKDLATVHKKIGVSTDNITHSAANKKLIEGCSKLGYSVSVVPQNTFGKPHHCGKCYTGCKSGIKSSTTYTWLKEAQAFGAKFLDQSRVTQILVKKGKVIGVTCNVHGIQNHVYHADRVIIAAGALHTPSLMTKCGLRNPNIGKHLRLHLASVCVAIYDENTHPCQGSLLTSVSNQFENFDGKKHGFKIECFTQGLGMYSGMVSWEGAKSHKELMLRYKNAVITFALMRDKDTKCSVMYDNYGKCDIRCSLSEHDAFNLKEGAVQMAKIHVAAGARQVHITQHSIQPFVFKDDESSDVDNPRFLNWLDQIYKLPPPTPSSGHQMGSCRMGTSPKTSAVKPNGEAWDVENLYVADASVFPTALGVNPMVTIQSIALHVSRSIIEAFKNQHHNNQL